LPLKTPVLRETPESECISDYGTQRLCSALGQRSNMDSLSIAAWNLTILL